MSAIFKTFMVLAFVALSSAARASVFINPDFNDGLSSWSTNGTVTAIGGGAVFTDNDALRSMLYQGAAVAGGTHLLSFDYRSPLSAAIPPGSAADALFATLYLSSTPEIFNPVTASGYDSFLALVDFDFSGALTYTGTTGASSLGPLYQLYQATVFIPAATTAFIVFDLNDLNAINNDSSFLIDNVSLVVPEPAMISLFGLGMLVWRSRRLCV